MIKKLYNKDSCKKMLSIATGLSIFMFTLIIFFNIYEVLAVKHTFNDNQKVFPLFLKGVLSDMTGVSRILLGLFVVSVIIPNKLFGRAVSKFIMFIIGLIIMLLFVSSSLFFINALVPLDHSIFLYSLQEILLTIKATNLGFIVYFTQFLLLLILISIVVFAKFGNKAIISTFIILLVSGLGLYPISKQIVKNEKSLLISHLIRCKSDYLIYKSFDYLRTPKVKVAKNEKLIKQFLKHRVEDGFLQPSDTNNVETQKELMSYPLLHKNNYNPLEPYFKPFTQKPNLVFIIVESLDARVFNDFYQQGITLTPFLNSLKNKSLFWNKCYSAAERTYGVLPAVFGSLPMGKEGFNEANPIPLHKTLISVLGEHKYQTNFFYGGWVGFQKMSNFLSYQSIHHLVTDYPKEYEYKGKDFNWGIVDDLVFKHSFVVMDSINKSPFLNIYLTLSTHEPYHLPDKDSLIAQMKRLNKDVEKKTMNKILADNYLSVLYTDNSIKQLINDYRARGLADNTIFIIMGDHCMHSFGKENNLQTYGIPLFIYSNLLKTNKAFHSPVSHLDIAPSFFNLLNERAVIHKDSLFHCLGLGLDTATTRSRNIFIPFMTNNRDIYECLYNQYFLYKNEAYIIGENNKLTPLEDKKIIDKLKKRLQVYNYINEYTVHNNRIYPIKYFSNKKTIRTVEEYSKQTMKLVANETTDYMTIRLEEDYDKLFFDYSFEMIFADTIKNPKFEIRIYDENDKYLDYFWFYNDSYMNSSNKTNQMHRYKITRTIFDKNNTIFREGNKIDFRIIDNKKTIVLRNLEVKIVSY